MWCAMRILWQLGWLQVDGQPGFAGTTSARLENAAISARTATKVDYLNANFRVVQR